MGRVVSNIDQFNADLDKAVDDGLTEAATVLARAMKRIMGSEGGGIKGAASSLKTRKQRRRKGKAQYISSPPGAAPGIRTGDLRRSITSTKAENGEAQAGSNLEYAVHLEYGTKRKGQAYMAARPWAGRSLSNAIGDMANAFANRVSQRLSGGGGQ